MCIKLLSRKSISRQLILCSSLLLSTVTSAAYAKSTWVGIVGLEQARTVQASSKKDVQQIETIVQGIGIDFAGLNWHNTTAAKFNRHGNITVARNWAYGYWNENFGLSLDIIKGDWQGVGPSIFAAGVAYKNCSGDLCFRINPTLARLDNKLADGSNFNDHGAQLNVKLDYKAHDRLSLSFHPQYAYWQSDTMGSTLKLELGATFDLTESKRHKLMLVNEHFMVNNRASGLRTRYVGENAPIAGYVPGTESTIKLRYAWIF